MSLDIEWSTLDDTLADKVRQFLNQHFKTITKPSFIGDIEVTAFGWGTETPHVEIIDIVDPLPEFYEPTTNSLTDDDDIDDSGQSGLAGRPSPSLYSPPPQASVQDPHEPQHTPRYSSSASSIHPSATATAGASPNSNAWDHGDISSQAEPEGKEETDTSMDFQVNLFLSYKGDMTMTLLTELRMNYPSMMFMSLPIQLTVRSIEFEATAAVAYLQSLKRVCATMFEPIPDDSVPLSRARTISLDSLLKDVHIESIVGDKEKQVLINVGKIERFIVEQLRKMLDDELVFPSYQCIVLGEPV